MHESVLKFCEGCVPDVAGKDILEVGSYDVNGSVRPQIEAKGCASYLGIDIAAGPRVDLVVSVQTYAATAGRQFDVVISCEALEHCEDWKGAFRAMCALLKPGGTLILTTRGPGFPYHNPPDHWRFDYMTIALAAQACGMIDIETHDDPQVPGVFLKARRAEMPDAIPMPQPQAAE